MRVSSWTVFAALMSAASLAFAPVVADALAPPGPIQTITLSEYHQLVDSGQGIPINRRTRKQWEASRRAAAAAQRAVVEGFIHDHPELPDFARFVQRTPRSRDVVRTADGNYLLQVPTTQGPTHTVETMGNDMVLAEIANSLMASADPTEQRALYQAGYSQYGALYARLCTTPPTPPSGCANLPPPSALVSPSVLQNASLGVIKNALESLGSPASLIVKVLPFLPSTGLASCSGDRGNDSSLPADAAYGDQSLRRDSKTGAVTDSAACGIPSPVGILANFTWANKDRLTCVKEQGARGTCHVFAATSAVEEMVGIDTGKRVNLSEQDFMEHAHGVWDVADFFHDGGNPKKDLLAAASNGYQFAYEDQWDYNPSYARSSAGSMVDAHSCKDYPTPPEAGCSNSSPQEPEFCVLSSPRLCLYVPATLSGARSPYMVNAAAVGSLWDSSATSMVKDGYVGLIKLDLVSDNAVILGLKTTHNFHNPVNGYIAYDASDTKGALNLTGGHLVHLVGYIDNEALASNDATNSQPPGAGGGYFIIKNSYGYCSGDAGYLYMPVQYLKDTATGVTVLSSITH